MIFLNHFYFSVRLNIYKKIYPFVLLIELMIFEIYHLLLLVIHYFWN